MYLYIPANAVWVFPFIFNLNNSPDVVGLVFQVLACYCHGHVKGGSGYFKENVCRKPHSREEEGKIVFEYIVVQS